ncbi:MAG: hypothetical protein AAGE52_38655, partial [Myxococcota bacterium]
MDGSFGIGAAGAVDATDRKGVGYTVTRTGVGVYRIAFGDRPLLDVFAIMANLEEAAASPLVVKVAARDIPNKTIDLRVTNVSAAGAAA